MAPPRSREFQGRAANPPVAQHNREAVASPIASAVAKGAGGATAIGVGPQRSAAACLFYSLGGRAGVGALPPSSAIAANNFAGTPTRYLFKVRAQQIAEHLDINIVVDNTACIAPSRSSRAIPQTDAWTPCRFAGHPAESRLTISDRGCSRRRSSDVSGLGHGRLSPTR